ncbi:hypothetical protein PFISCL1PPCAC_13153, partial [Pristionchus fissidentatus]
FSMSSPWLKNFAGVKQSETEVQRVPNALVELGIHITCKTIQACTVLGSIIGTATALMLRKSLRLALARGGQYGALVGVAMGFVVTVASTRNKTEPEIYDRCYRLRHNTGQLWVDRSFALAAPLGFVAAGGLGLVAGINSAVFVTPIGRVAWNKIS